MIGTTKNPISKSEIAENIVNKCRDRKNTNPMIFSILCQAIVVNIGDSVWVKKRIQKIQKYISWFNPWVNLQNSDVAYNAKDWYE